MVRYSIDAEPIAAPMHWCRVCQFIGAGGATVMSCSRARPCT